MTTDNITSPLNALKVNSTSSHVCCCLSVVVFSLLTQVTHPSEQPDLSHLKGVFKKAKRSGSGLVAAPGQQINNRKAAGPDQVSEPNWWEFSWISEAAL